jgi:hypothetical protein
VTVLARPATATGVVLYRISYPSINLWTKLSTKPIYSEKMNTHFNYGFVFFCVLNFLLLVCFMLYLLQKAPEKHRNLFAGYFLLLILLSVAIVYCVIHYYGGGFSAILYSVNSVWPTTEREIGYCFVSVVGIGLG